MTQLWCLNRDHPDVKNILIPEELESSRPPAELLVEEGVVIRLPTDLPDIEVARHTEVPTEAA